MTYILDIAVLVILGLTVFFGYRRGFLQTVVQLVGCVAAFIIALSISTPAANTVFDSFVAESVETRVMESLNDVADVPVEEKLDAAIAELPKPVGALLKNNAQLQEAVDELGTSMSASVDSLAKSLVQTVVRPVVVTVLQLLIFVLAFLLLLLIAKLLARVVKPIAKLPVIRQIDGTLGAVLGVLKGALFVCVLVSVLQLIAVAASDNGLITQNVLDNTFLVRYIADINPLKGILS